MAVNPFAQFVEAAPDVEDEEPRANPFAQFLSDEPLEEEAPARELKQVAPGIWTDKSIGEIVQGSVEVLATVASSALAEPISGLAGVGATAFGGAESGAETVEGVREAMIYQPGTEAGQEFMGDVGSFLAPVGEALGAVETWMGEGTMAITGSPELAALAHTVPTALLEVLGLGLLKRPSQAAMQAAKIQRRIKIEPSMTPDQIAKEVIEPELRPWEQITEDLRLGNKARVAKEVRPDADILAAAEELGIDLNPSHYSTNEAYRRVEQSVKSQPDTRLATREAEAITKLGEQADALIGEYAGSLDKSLLNTRVRSEIEGTIKDLKKAAEQSYKRVNDVVAPAQKVNARASKAYLRARLEELGGDISGLSKSERMLHTVLSQKGAPTYARLDQLRRDVGQGFKQKGQFADDLSGNLDQVYGALIRDQQGIADFLGAGPDFAAGRKLVETRKDLEKQAIKMFGRDLNQSFLPKITQAATALTKGDVQQFKNLMQALPENMRAPAAATLLNDLFMHGTRSGGSIGQGFATAYRNLNRNAGAKAEIFKYLPATVKRRFDAIGRVSEGIYRAKALENTSRTARDILQALESGNAVSRIMDRTSDIVLGRMTFVPGPTRWLAAGAKAAKEVAKKGFDNAAAADKLMSSPEFSRAMAKAMEGQVDQANTMIKRSAAWQAWRNTLGEGTKAQLASVGPIAWLTTPPVEPAPPPEPAALAETSPATMPPVGPPAEAIAGVQ